MSDKTPTDFKGNTQPDFITPADHEGIIAARYRSLESDYRHKVKRERTVQVGTTFLSSAAAGIEVIVFFLVKKALDINIPLQIVLFNLRIFLFLMAITVLGFIQLILISRWNRQLNKQSRITLANYAMIQRIKYMLILIGVILIICGLFFFMFLKTPLPPPPTRFIRIWKTLQILRQLAFITIIGYSFSEFIQLIRWSRRLRSVHKLEHLLLQEMPELKGITQ